MDRARRRSAGWTHWFRTGEARKQGDSFDVSLTVGARGSLTILDGTVAGPGRRTVLTP